MTKINLGIHKRFLIIDSPIDFELLANYGTDSVKRSSGTWSIDCYKLLPEEYQKNYPVYNLQLIYDEKKLNEDEEISYSFTDMDLGQALKGVNGQVVELTSMQLQLLKPYNFKDINLIDDFKFFSWSYPEKPQDFLFPLKQQTHYYCKNISFSLMNNLKVYAENCIIRTYERQFYIYGSTKLERTDETINETLIANFENSTIREFFGILKELNTVII